MKLRLVQLWRGPADSQDGTQRARLLDNNALDDVSQDFINIASAEITINWSVIYFYNGSSYGRDTYTL